MTDIVMKRNDPADGWIENVYHCTFDVDIMWWYWSFRDKKNKMKSIHKNVNEKITKYGDIRNSKYLMYSLKRIDNIGYCVLSIFARVIIKNKPVYKGKKWKDDV